MIYTIFFAQNVNIQYDDNSNIYQSKHLKSLSNLWSKDWRRINILIRTKDIKEIWLKYPDNLCILSKSSIKSPIKICISWYKSDLIRLTEDLKYIPRHMNITLTDFYKIEFSFLDYINEEFWRTVIEFSSILFKWKEKKEIRLEEIIGDFNSEDLSKNNFKISINDYSEIVTYSILWIMLSS